MKPKILGFMIDLVTNLVEGLLGLRIILKLLGASTTAPFVTWIYNTTQPLLNPFNGMFPSSEIVKGFYIEFSAVFALIAYSFLGYILSQATHQLASLSISHNDAKGKK